MTYQSVWDDEAKVEMLAALWKEGMSTRDIGERLGVSRNAVIGKLHRSGMSDQDREARLRPKRERVQVKHMAAKRRRNFGSVWGAYSHEPQAPFQPRPAEALPALNLTILEVRDGQCRYMAGDDYLCCGHPVADGKPYCLAHCRLAYTATSTRNRYTDRHINFVAESTSPAGAPVATEAA